MQAFSLIHRLPKMGFVRSSYDEVETRCGIMVHESNTRKNDWQPQEGELLVDRALYCPKCFPDGG